MEGLRRLLVAAEGVVYFYFEEKWLCIELLSCHGYCVGCGTFVELWILARLDATFELNISKCFGKTLQEAELDILCSKHSLLCAFLSQFKETLTTG